MISAKIVKDSMAPSGIRLTTFVLTYPRFIHAEFMTHRVFSRNASSSRAIPVGKQIAEIYRNPAVPLDFKANKAGMQAGEAFGPLKQFLCRLVWRGACLSALFFAKLMEKLNVHKQYANRIAEPFSHITVVVSATDWDNFFALRYHPAAQPEICELAKQMWEAYSNGSPRLLSTGKWHLPFVHDDEAKELGEDFAIKASVARCARVSYLNHEGKKPSLGEDLKLYQRLLGQVPIHASPAEHQARAENGPLTYSGNLRGWTQYRKLLPNENIAKFTKPSSEQS